jgi:ElaB/YqjD/DUF883 family membrane-anchored ribosome-binding protein
MDEEALKKKSEAVVREARRVIAEAEKALKRTDDYFAEHGLTPEKLMLYLDKQDGNSSRRELDNAVERTMREAREDAQRAIESARVQHAVKSVRRRIRSLV